MDEKLAKMTSVIGVTTAVERVQWGVWDQVVALLGQTYLDGIAQAGGVPIMLPPNEFGAREVVERIDALVLSGGADIDPARFGQDKHPRTVIREDRDKWELAIVEAALERDLPILAICRGIQVLNVALGGTLQQHLPDTLGHSDHLVEPGTFASNSVRIEADSKVGKIIGSKLDVPCHHHQAIDELGKHLRATGKASDGVVEAVEHTEARFVIGVQWHPEQDLRDLRLFEALIEEAQARKAGR